ncbi:amidase signature enzyme [Cadophora sp. DSE1049]|nr:amidase signature enzyme [Cadophora sp. DSE1049]
MSIISVSAHLWTGLVIFATTIYFFSLTQPTGVNVSNTSGSKPNMMSKAAFDVLTADIKTLQNWLQHGQGTSAKLVEIYLAQIQRHDGYLHAMTQVRQLELLMETASSLDKERQAGHLRGPLHGIPIIIKDNIATHPSFGLKTTAGSLALFNSKPPKNAKIVDMLIAAGAIILGKSNLSELANYRQVGIMLPSGWSATGGQIQSVYSPSGSSSGSAVAVSAGYAPVSLGTETDVSLVCPAGRAALYTLKPTIGLVPQAGIVPVSQNFDSAGPMTKTVADLAIVLDAITDGGSNKSFTSSLTGSWSDISVGALDPEVWKFPNSFIRPTRSATLQTNADIQEAYMKIKPLAKSFSENVPLRLLETIELNGESSEMVITRADLRDIPNAYLKDLDDSDVRSVQDIIDFNIKHADEELPPGHANQDFLIAVQEQQLGPNEYNDHFENMRRLSREEGIDLILQKYGLDVIIGPADSFIFSLATCSGYPVAAMPLSYLYLQWKTFGNGCLGW